MIWKRSTLMNSPPPCSTDSPPWRGNICSRKMNLLFAAVGKPRAPWARVALEHYQRFLAKYARCDWRWVRDAPGSLNARDVRRIETDRILDAVADANGFKILCDSGGQLLDTPAFASSLRQGVEAHSNRAVIVIGGPWGLDERARDWADFVWSLGPLTLPHELALIVAAEQMARALSILRGDAYHR